MTYALVILLPLMKTWAMRLGVLAGSGAKESTGSAARAPKTAKIQIKTTMSLACFWTIIGISPEINYAASSCPGRLLHDQPLCGADSLEKRRKVCKPGSVISAYADEAIICLALPCYYGRALSDLPEGERRTASSPLLCSSEPPHA